jgi:hypothetical protein
MEVREFLPSRLQGPESNPMQVGGAQVSSIVSNGGQTRSKFGSPRVGGPVLGSRRRTLSLAMLAAQRLS